MKFRTLKSRFLVGILSLVVAFGVCCPAVLAYEPLLCVAAAEGDLGKVRRLVENDGAYVNCVNERYQTPLYLAAEYNQLMVVKYLVEHGADVSFADISGDTPLHAAARSGGLEVAKYLVAHGANLNRSNDNGDISVTIAYNMGDRCCRVYEFLKSKMG